MTKPHPMQQFHDMLALIVAEGKRRPNRTGMDTLFVPGHMLKFDMADGFPAITTKQLFFKQAKGELWGFFRGCTSAAEFRELGCRVWDDNANKTPAWLANPNRKGQDDLGRIYGAQWTDWRDWREAESEAAMQELLAKGYEVRAHDTERGVWVMRRGMNQLEIALKAIMTNPTDRRIIVTGWRPDEFDLMALPPCHVDYQFLVDTTTGSLHLCFYQRSFDSALAFNVSLAALFLHVMAKLSGLTASTLSHFVGDGHIYCAHLEGVQEMLSREHYAQPGIDLSCIPTLSSADEIPGIFKRLDLEPVKLVNYKCHPAIRFPMAA
ncbi:thymidylate synthase [Paraburkholderia sp. A3RO-2L]|uniref:thymidylate synthase n=1 Tax=unclassified Paraburkholderia TaxID=2615204 RepID=UPI003DA99558